MHTGGWIISGSGSAGRSHDNLAGDQTHIGVQPTGLVFVTPNLAIGAGIALSYTDNSSGHSYSYGLGPTARYYFGTQDPKWLPFVGASVTPQWLHEQVKVIIGSTSQTLDANLRSLAFDGSVGLTRLVVEHVGVTGEAYYTNSQLSGGSRLVGGGRHAYDAGLRFGLTVFVH